MARRSLSLYEQRCRNLAHRDFLATSSITPATTPITKLARTISRGASPKYAIYPTIQSDPTNQIAIDKEFGSFPIVTPSVGGSGTGQAHAPTGASRPVGVISHSAGIGGLHPHQRFNKKATLEFLAGQGAAAPKDTSNDFGDSIRD
jgi:hypothetical protein